MTKNKINGRKVSRGIIEDKGIVYIRISVDGKLIKKSIGSVRDPNITCLAEVKLRELREQKRLGKLGFEMAEKKIQLSQALDVYWEIEAKKKPSSPTIRGFIERFRSRFGTEFVDSINFTHTVALREWLKSMGLKMSTINRHHGCWRRIFNFLVEMKRIKTPGYSNIKLPEFNPGTPVRSKPETHLQSEIPFRRRRVVSPEEFRVFCNYASDRVKKICYLAVLTTLRRSDLRRASNGEASLEGGFLEGIQGKVNSAYRIPLTSYGENLIMAGIDWTNFRKEFEIARKASGVDYFQFRDLRKSLPSILRKTKCDIKKISEILGHSNIQMTEIYLPVDDEEKMEAVSLASKAFIYPDKLSAKLSV